MSSGNYYDNHTLYVKCDSASKEQITTAFHEALENYQNATGAVVECRFRVNLISNREGKLYGVAFVFITNSDVYHMLLGKNPDGSDRVTYIDDPSWVAPSGDELTNDSGWSSISPPVHVGSVSW